MTETRYRLIAGTINEYLPEPGWHNVHLDVANRGIWNGELNLSVAPDVVEDVAAESMRGRFRQGMFDAVRFHHVLEHLSRTHDRAGAALRNLAWVTKPGGELDIEVPDFAAIAGAWYAGDLDTRGLDQWLYGEFIEGHHGVADLHKSAWTEGVLGTALEQAGWSPGERIEAGYAIRYVATREQP